MIASRIRLLLFTGALGCVGGACPAQSPGPAGAWWAYKPLQRPPVPAVRDASWPHNDVDRFVLAGLEAAGIAPSPPADKVSLLRRLTFDLTGLPPTLEDVAAFVADSSPDAYERVVDRLLGSPQYGVKYGRHWLDVVRYAETDGYERDRQKPFIWRYRDWVIDAFNRDLPYGEFVTTQLAGDEKPAPSVADLVATGYYRLGIWDDEPTDAEQARYDDLDSIADTTARAMLGISMGCARCHDHKRDPVTQREYYAFLAWFENVRPPDLQSHAVPQDGAAAAFAAETAEYVRRGEQLRAGARGAADAAWAALPPMARVDASLRMNRGLLAHYGGERTSGTQVFDDVGEHHGTVHGQVVPAPGHIGQAMHCNGGNDRFELPRLVQDDFSVSLWVRSKERGRGDGNDPRWYLGSGLVDADVDGPAKDWGIAWLADGRVAAGVGGPEVFVASGPGNDDGEWHHVGFTRQRSSGRIALYVDGRLVGEATGGKDALDAPTVIRVGAEAPAGSGFRGDLDELSFFDRALDADEVLALALDLKGGVAAPFVLTTAPTATNALASFAELRALKRPDLATVQVLAVQEHGEPPPSFVRLRGNVHQKGPQVEPAVPQCVGGGAPKIAPRAGLQSSGRRSALAQWITEPQNPLTWRVAANRAFQWHFGRGLSRAPNDFGRLGELPTHPELLDWLATELLARGQQLKAIHRLLVTSSTYRMAATPDASKAALDPRNDRFWRFDPRRLDAEEVRDAMLAAAGVLNLQTGGPSVFPPLPKEVLATSSRPDEAWGHSPPDQANRRSAYVHSKRSLLEPLLAAFDQADTDSSCPVRFATVQPTQALILFNGEFANRTAAAFAARLAAAVPERRGQLALGLRLVTCREPAAADLDRLLQLDADLQKDHGRTPAESLQRCCLVLLNCNEFLFLD